MRLIGILLAMLVPALSMGQDALIPEEGPFVKDQASAYHLRVYKELTGKIPYDVRVQMVVIPSFKEEHMIRVQDTTLHYAAFDQCLWSLMGAAMRKAGNGSITYNEENMEAALAKVTVGVRTKSVTLKKETVELLESVWDTALKAARPLTKPEGGNDGTTYYFANWKNGFGTQTGNTWSPEASTKMGALVDLGNSLIELANGGNGKASEAAIVANAKALLKRLQAN